HCTGERNQRLRLTPMWHARPVNTVLDRILQLLWRLLSMKVAAYQAPLLASGSMEALALIRKQVEWCESAGVEILCCPEGILGGLADYSTRPRSIAIDVEDGQ